MATFKATSNKKDNGVGVFKATKNKSYDASYLSRLDEENRSSANIINDYITRRKNNEWMSEDEISNYRSALERYKSSGDSLVNIQRSMGTFSEEDENERIANYSSILEDIDFSSRYFGRYGSADEYSSAIAETEKRNTAKTANLEDINKEILDLEKQASDARTAKKDNELPIMRWIQDQILSDDMKNHLYSDEDISAKIQEKRNWYNYVKSVQDYENHSADELFALANESVNNDDRLYWLGLGNQHAVQDNIDILSNTMMDGEDVTVLDAVYDLQHIDDDDERKQREDVIRAKMDTIGLPFDDYYSRITGERNISGRNFGRWLGATALTGVNAWNKGISSTADLIFGKPLQGFGWENNPISAMAKYYDESYDNYVFDRNMYNERMGGGQLFDYAGQVIEGTISAVPDAILAWMTAGMSKYGALAKAPSYVSKLNKAGDLGQVAVYASGDKLTKAGLTVQGMMKNPNYWSSFARTYGLDYEEAKAMGASDVAAVFGATISSLINAGIEIGVDGGSGFQGFAQDIAAGNKNKFFAWVESILEEGGEEVLQGFVNNLVAKTMYDDSTELANLEQMVADGAMGMAVGVFLGGGQITLGSAVDKVNRTKAINEAYNKHGGDIIKSGGVDAVKDVALKFAGEIGGREGKALAKSANAITNNSKARDIGVLVDRVNTARSKLNKADIQSALVQKGVGKAQAKNYANILVAMNEEYFNGNDSSFTLGTDEQWRKMTGDENAYSILREIVTNSESAANMRNRKQSNAMRGIRMDENGNLNEEDVKQFRERVYAKATDGGLDPDVQNDFAVSVEGKTIVDGYDGEVQKLKFVDGESGGLKMNVNGDTDAELSSIAFGDIGEALVVSSIVKMGIGSSDANAIYSLFKGKGEKAGNTFSKGVGLAFKYGRYHYSPQKLNSIVGISRTAAQVAFNAGQKSVSKAVEEAKSKLESAAESNASKGEKIATKGSVVFEGKIADKDGNLAADERSLTDIQRASVEGLKLLAELSPLNFHIFQSEKDGKTFTYVKKNGQKTHANGWYRVGTNDIYIDLNAGSLGQGVMMETAAHEISHFIKEYSPEKWNDIAKYIMDEYVSKYGDKVDVLLMRKIALVKARADSKSKTQQQIEDEAFEELVCDSLSRMLIDGTVVEAMANIKQKNKSVWNTIKKAVQKLLDKWSAVIDQYKDRTADAEEATYFSETSKSFKKLQEMLTEAFVDASDTYSKVGNLQNQESDMLSNGHIAQNTTAAVSSQESTLVKANEGKPSERITANMSDEERYKLLKNRKMTLAVFNEANYNKVISERPVLLDKKLKEKDAKDLLKKVGSEFGVFKQYDNADVEIEFEFGKNNLDESIHKQKGNYDVYAQMLSCFSDVIANAVGVEVHNRNSEGYKPDRTLKNVYVLCSAFENNTDIIPVKLEIKEFYDKPNRLYVAVALEGIKKDRVKSMGVPTNRSHIRTSPVTISIYDLFSNVNPIDVDFLKYIPTGFLSAEQKERISDSTATRTEPEVKEKLSERDYPIDSVVEKMVDDAFSKSASAMNELGAITAEQNKAINRLVNQAGDESYRGKYEGGKHRFSDTAIRHIMSEHGDFLREGLRAQLPMRKEDIARHLSAIKENKMPSSIKPTRTSRGNPSILTSYEVNGYTLYAEEITKSLGKNLPSDLIGHTMYKAPTLATAAAPATSAGVLPRRQDQVLCNYNMPNNGNLSRGNFVADKNGRPVLLHYVSKKGSPNVDILHGGLIALSSDESNLTDQSGIVEQGYVLCEKPYYITQDHRIFDNSKADVSAKVSELKKQGYDCFIFDKTPGDNYMVAVVNKAQIVKTAPTVIEEEKASERVADSTSARLLLANALESTIDTSTQEGQIELKRLEEYQEMIGTLDDLNSQLIELREGIFLKGVDGAKRKQMREDAAKIANRISIYDKKLLTLEASKPLKKVLDRERSKATKLQKKKDAQLFASYKEESEKKRKAEAEHYRELRKKAVEKLKESKAKTDARDKLQKLVLKTVKWISYPKQDEVKCPDILRVPYANFLRSIDLSSKTFLEKGEKTKKDLRIDSALSSLARAIEKIKTAQNPEAEGGGGFESGYLDLPASFIDEIRDKAEEFTQMVSAGGDVTINGMSAKDIKEITKLIRTLNHSIREMSTLYSNMRFSKVEEIGKKTISYMEELGNVKSTNAVNYFVAWENALPYYAFKRFGEGGESIFEELMDAQDKMAFLAKTILDFREKSWTSKESKVWSEDTHTIELSDGKTLTLTTADAMSIYCLSRRDNEQGLRHLVVGGVRVPGQKKGAQTMKDSRANLDLEDVMTICASLNDRQKEVAESIQEFMSFVCSDWGNEISMKRFLTKDFTEKQYFPIQSNDEVLAQKDPQAQQTDLYRLLNISAAKPITPKANNSVVVRNIFDVFTEHTSDMARLNAYGMALLDYMKWINYNERSTNEKGQISVRGVRSAMNDAYGDKAKLYVINLIKDINGRFSDNGDHPWLTKALRNAKTAAVGSSLRTAVLQLTSYPRAAMVLSVGNLVKGMSRRPQISKAKDHCGIALWKSFGFYDTNIARSIEDQIKGTTNWKQKLIELSLKGAEWGDAITWGYLWNACEYNVANSNKQLKPGTEEFDQAVAKKLREVVYATQVVDSVLTKTQIMRSKSALTQTATAFMSEPAVTYNILMDSGFQFNLEKRRTGSAKLAWQKTGRQIIKSVTVFGSVQVLTALVESLIDAYRDDDDEEFVEKFSAAMSENLISDILVFNKLPIISDLIDGVLSFFGMGYFSTDRMDTAWMSDLITAATSWKKVLGEAFGTKETSLTVYKALYDTATAVSTATGVAYSGLVREIVTLWNNTAGAADPDLKIKKYDE